MADLEPEILAVVRAGVREAVGPGARVVRLEPLTSAPTRAVVRATVAGLADPLVVKVAGPPADFERTAAVVTLAAAAGVPTAEVLTARTARAGDDVGYLVQRHVDGVEWRRLRPTLDENGVRSVHRQIADTVLALQATRLPAFGRLDAACRPPGHDLLTALHRRADLLIADSVRRADFLALLDRDADLFADDRPTLSHDDLHHDNVVLAPVHGTWRLAAVLDWDKAWAGPAESDVARMAFWDDMTGPGFWEVYRAAVPAAEGWPRRALIHQLLWCLEYDVPSVRHRADTLTVAAALALRSAGPGKPRAEA